MKTSLNVSQQVPEYILTEYPAFIEFLEAYYQWIEEQQSIGLTEDLVDIDDTIDRFVEYFRSELDILGVTNFNPKERFYLQKIKQLYKAKGSEAAFKFFFRLLYNKDSEVYLPWEQTLKLSDGKWVQDASIFIEISTGTPDLIVEKTVTVTTADQVFDVFIERYQQVEIEVNGVKQYSNTIFEFFIDKSYVNQIIDDAKVTYKSSFIGYTKLTTTNYTIFQQGEGFKLGDVYEVRGGVGSGSLFKVTKVGPKGELIYGQFIKFGTNYPKSFTIAIQPKTKQEKQIQSSLSINDNTITREEQYLGLKERGLISLFDYNRSQFPTPLYVDSSYAGQILGGFHDDNYTIDRENEDAQYAIVYVLTGVVAKYPGYYSTNHGFLSDSVCLQDNYFYQVYSYVVRVEEQLTQYKTVLKQLLHPTGLMLFGDYDILSQIDLKTSLLSTSTSRSISLFDRTESADDFATKLFGKSVKDDSVEVVFDQDSFKWDFNKYIEDKPLQEEFAEIWKNAVFEYEYAMNDGGYYTEGVVRLVYVTTNRQTTITDQNDNILVTYNS